MQDFFFFFKFRNHEARMIMSTAGIKIHLYFNPHFKTFPPLKLDIIFDVARQEEQRKINSYSTKQQQYHQTLLSNPLVCCLFQTSKEINKQAERKQLKNPFLQLLDQTRTHCFAPHTWPCSLVSEPGYIFPHQDGGMGFDLD